MMQFHSSFIAIYHDFHILLDKMLELQNTKAL